MSPTESQLAQILERLIELTLEAEEICHVATGFSEAPLEAQQRTSVRESLQQLSHEIAELRQPAMPWWTSAPTGPWVIR